MCSISIVNFHKSFIICDTKHNGTHYLPASCLSTYSGDLTLDEDFVQSAKLYSSNNTTTAHKPFEQFSSDNSITAHCSDGTDLDPILEICIDDIRGETLSLVASNESRVQLPSADKEFMSQLVEESHDNTGG